MKRVKAESKTSNDRSFRPALSPEARENQLISLAYDLAEEQLRNGTASSQVITQFLKLGSSKDRLERRILEKQEKLITAKTDAIESEARTDEMYTEAIKAMKSYSGQDGDDEYDEFDD